MTLAQAAALAVYLAAFAVATFRHASDLLRFGWLPYDFAPQPLNAFWTSLTFLDPLVIVLLVTGHRRLGLILAAAVMVADVAVNCYAYYALGHQGFAPALLLQTAFFGFVLGSLPFLWPDRKPERATKRWKEKR